MNQSITGYIESTNKKNDFEQKYHNNIDNTTPHYGIKNPLVITLISLACVVLVLIIILICLVQIYKNNSDDSDDNTKKGGGYKKWLIPGMYYNKNNNKNSKKNHYKNNKENDPSGWQLYTLKGCPHCTHQLEDLKGFNTFVEFERGNPNPIINNIKGELYPRNKINGFPFWYNSKTGDTKMGKQNICNLNPKIKSAKC